MYFIYRFNFIFPQCISAQKRSFTKSCYLCEIVAGVYFGFGSGRWSLVCDTGFTLSNDICCWFPEWRSINFFVKFFLYFEENEQWFLCLRKKWCFCCCFKIVRRMSAYFSFGKKKIHTWSVKFFLMLKCYCVKKFSTWSPKSYFPLLKYIRATPFVLKRWEHFILFLILF